MEKSIKITGVTKEQLDKALDMYYSMFLCNGIVHRGLNAYQLVKAKNEETLELHFYWFHADKNDVNMFPCEMSKDTLVGFVWDWLSTHQVDHDILTDGSLGKGWTLEGKDWFHEYDDNPKLIVRFTTMVYGK